MALKAGNRGEGSYMKDTKRGTGKQDIDKGGDFGARTEWAKAANPPSVKEMVGPENEFSRYKHDQQ